MQRTLLTKELDDALDAYENPKEKSFLESMWGSIFPSPDPLKFLIECASLALIEAAAKNRLAYVKQLARVSSTFISQDEYFAAIYFALVAAAQGGHSEIFNEFFTGDFAPVIGDILKRGMNTSLATSASPDSFLFIDFTSSRAKATQYPLTNRLGLSQLPNLMIEVSHYGRLDMLEKLLSSLSWEYVNQKGYYPCLSAAVAGHVTVMEKFFEYDAVLKEILVRKDAICHAAMQGQLAVVEKLLERQEYPAYRLDSTLQYSTADVIERLLKEPNIDTYLKYAGDNKAHLNGIKQCGYYACYANSSKSFETAAKMFQMLLKYPVIAQLAEESKNANSDNVVYAVLKKLNMIPAKTIESPRISLSKSGLFTQSGLPDETVEDEMQCESSYSFNQ